MDDDYNPIRAMVLEARAHYLRMLMLSDRDLMAGIRRGAAEAERGETIDFEELERRVQARMQEEDDAR